MNHSLIIFFMTCYTVFGYSQNSHRAYMYITPRNVNYGWADGGVFQFKLNKKSIKVPYSKRSYSMITKHRRVYELYYTKAKIPDSLYKNLIQIKENCWKGRIMIVISQKDTLLIDTQYNVCIKNKCYKISNELKTFIEKQMPIGIRESWQKNLPPR